MPQGNPWGRVKKWLRCDRGFGHGLGKGDWSAGTAAVEERK